MTTHNLAHLARLLQELNQNFHNANLYLSQAWDAHERMRDALKHFSIAQKERMTEEKQGEA